MSTLVTFTTPIQLVRGRSFSVTPQIQDSNGNVVDVSSWSAVGFVSTPNQPSQALSFSGFNSSGNFTFGLSAGNTSLIPAGSGSRVHLTLTEADGVTTHDFVGPIAAVSP